MVIKVAVISHDRSLVRLCRATLAELFGPEFSLSVGFARELLPESDLCIWDFVPGQTEIALDHLGLQDHFFAVQGKDVAALRELVGSSNLNLLLKPLTPATLRAFLGEACRRWQDRDKDLTARRLRVERDELLQCLIQANLRLQEHDQERTTFLARSLHDFHAPLTAISGYCAMLLGKDFGSLTTEQHEVLERMQGSIRRLSRMTNAMFELSVPDRVEPNRPLEGTDVRECIDEALQELAPWIDEKQISVNVDIEPPDLLAFDSTHLEQVFVNLLDNACRFTPRAGGVDIKGYPYFWERRVGRPARIDPSVDRRVEQSSAPNSFRIDVQDSGPGIPLAQLGTIFEEFKAYSGGRDRSGGGLGLAVCRMIVRQHQGKIWAENGPAGAVFSFVLPYQRSEAIVTGDDNDSGRAFYAVKA